MLFLDFILFGIKSGKMRRNRCGGKTFRKGGAK